MTCTKYLKIIGFSVTDPFDGFELYREVRPFSRAKCAEGEYRRMRANCLEAGVFIAKQLQRKGRIPLKMRTPRARMILV